jgi:hypothetical protein
MLSALHAARESQQRTQRYAPALIHILFLEKFASLALAA